MPWVTQRRVWVECQGCPRPSVHAPPIKGTITMMGRGFGSNKNWGPGTQGPEARETGLISRQRLVRDTIPGRHPAWSMTRGRHFPRRHSTGQRLRTPHTWPWGPPGRSSPKTRGDKGLQSPKGTGAGDQERPPRHHP